jgi:hypothetical protein
METSKKHLSFSALVKSYRDHLERVPDWRIADSVDYSICDTSLSALAMMHFQDESLLAFQRRLKIKEKRCNLETIFGVRKVPSDSQMRENIDCVPSASLQPIYRDYFSRLQRAKYLERFQIFPSLYLCDMDGSDYFSSEAISCAHCLTREKTNGKVTYTHQILQAALVHPEQKQVIPLCPEQIANSDGSDKNDCEMNAAKRLLRRLRREHPFLGLIINGDGLYSKQPMVELILELGMHFILVCKEDDHKILWEWFSEQKKLKEVTRFEKVDKKGRCHRYEWLAGVPLNGNDNTPLVNLFTYELIVAGKVTYKNSWVTDLKIDKENVETLVLAGRARWKVENECFNTLKNQGYNVAHNFGHGESNLAFNFFLINLLAFFIHQILELTNTLYQNCRAKLVTKKDLWECMRVYMRIKVFGSWDELAQFTLDTG